VTSISIQPAYPAALFSLVEDAQTYADASRASSTQRQYDSNWKIFEAFCAATSVSALPTSVAAVAVYLSKLAKEGKSISTVVSHYSAIKYFHDRARIALNWTDPLLQEVMSGIRRSSTRKVIKADALTPADLSDLIATTGVGLIGRRDQAILLVGFAGAFRRSEITAITVENLEFVPEGVVVLLERSKTDQEGEGAEVCIPHGANPALCPVRALRAWLEASETKTGPVFRRVSKTGFIGQEALSEEAIRLILAKAVERSGLITKGRVSPHSLRAGFCTTAALGGKSLEQIARHARHASTQTTLGYVRVAERFRNHAGAGLL
jgi:site-specific recombinase XerD